MVLMSTWCNFADRLAVKYTFQVNDGADIRTDLVVEPFNAVNEQNAYEVRCGLLLGFLGWYL